MSNLIFVIGGASSGKSRFAIELARKSGREVTFIATARPTDSEMREKIALHRRERPSYWQTIEAAETPFHVNEVKSKTTCLLLDSLSLWVSELLLKKRSQKEILNYCQSFFKKALAKFRKVIVVSDEVGLSLVPGNRLAREFREVLGVVNQEVAGVADQVFLVTAGLPVNLKRRSK